MNKVYFIKCSKIQSISPSLIITFTLLHVGNQSRNTFNKNQKEKGKN